MVSKGVSHRSDLEARSVVGVETKDAVATRLSHHLPRCGWLRHLATRWSGTLWAGGLGHGTRGGRTSLGDLSVIGHVSFRPVR